MQLPSSIAAFFITPQTSHDECERAYEAQAALVDEYRLTYAEMPPVVFIQPCDYGTDVITPA